MNDNMTTTANIIHNESFLRYSSKDVALCSKGIYDLKWNACGSYLACAIGDKTVKIGQLTESSVSSRPIVMNIVILIYISFGLFIIFLVSKQYHKEIL